MSIASPEGSPPSTTEETTIEGTAEVVSPAADAAPDANAAESSPADAQDAKEPVTLLSVIQDAVKAPEGEPSVAKDNQGQPEKAAAEGEAETPPDAAADPNADVPFHNHPRWKELLKERDALQEPARQFQQIETFMQANGLSADEVAEGYEVMALLKRGDAASFAKALEWFEPRVQYLREQVGAVLPADLQQQVEDGFLDEDIAKELAESRAKLKLTDAERERAAERDAEAARATEAAQVGQRMAQAVNSWEEQIKATDPDYAKKSEMVETFARSMVQQNGKPPANEQEAVALVKAAYDKTNEVLRSVVPKPRPVTPSPTSMSAKTTAAPKTLREAIELGLQA